MAASKARMLRPSRPMIRPLISSLSIWKTVTEFSIAVSVANRCIDCMMIFLASLLALILASSRPSETGNYLDFYDAVYDAIRNNAAMPVTCQQATDVMRIIEASVESSNGKKVVDIA